MNSYKSFSEALFQALLWFDELTKSESHINERIELFQKKKKLIIIKDFFDLLDADLCTMDIVAGIPSFIDLSKITTISIVCDQESEVLVRKDKKVHICSTKTAYFEVGNLKMLNGKPRPNSCKITLTD